jgi:hypothetical protein
MIIIDENANARTGHTGRPEKLKEREQMEDLDVEGRMIIKCVLKTEGERVWTGFFHIWI